MWRTLVLVKACCRAFTNATTFVVSRMVFIACAAALVPIVSFVLLVAQAIDFAADLVLWLAPTAVLAQVFNRRRRLLFLVALGYGGLIAARSIAGLKAGCVCVSPKVCMPGGSAPEVGSLDSGLLGFLAFEILETLGPICVEILARMGLSVNTVIFFMIVLALRA